MIDRNSSARNYVEPSVMTTPAGRKSRRIKIQRLGYPRLILEAISSSNVNIFEVLQSSVVDSTTLLNPYSHIALSEYRNIVKSCVKYFKSRSVSEEIYRQTSLRNQNLIGRIALTSESMLEAVNNIAKFSSLLGNTQLDIDVEGGFLFVSHKSLIDDVTCSRVDMESIFSFLLSMLSQMGNSRIEPFECTFASDSRATCSLPKSIYGKRISYGNKIDRLIFKVDGISVKTKRDTAQLNRQYISKATNYISELEKKDNMVDSVLLYLRRCDLKDSSSVDEAARFLRISSRILQRRLCAEGTSFIALLDRVRYEKSIELIRANNLNFKTVAFIVGYNSISAFHNAFRRWTGVTPVEFKKQSEICRH